MRHLTRDQAAGALRRGKQVEQLLDSEPHEGRRTVRWLTVGPSRGHFVVSAHHVYDEGNPEFLDVSEFSPIDDEEEWGEGTLIARLPDPEDALDAARGHGATPERWVNQGVIGDEYADARGWT